MRSWKIVRRLALVVGCGLLALSLGAAGYFASRFLFPSPAVPQKPGESEHHDHEHAGHVVMPKSRQAVAHIRIAPVEKGTFQHREWVTGKLMINQDRTAHIYPLVKGRVHEVKVAFGQEVKVGEVLAIIDSPEVGEAKLALVQERLATRIAKVNHEWDEKINKNTQQLIAAIRKDTPLPELDVQFRGQAMGDYRAELVTAYANRNKAQIDYERVANLKGTVPEKDILAAKTAFEGAQASLRALLEQSEFTAWQQELRSQQELERTQTGEASRRARLYILGYREGDLSALDPIGEGEAIAHYTVQAPFDATVISKHVVVDERVGPDTQMFQLADLSTVWVETDIYQKHLPLVQGLKGQRIRFRAPQSDHVHEAEVFYAGEILNEETRTARLMAVAENSDRHLKPGMFVEVGLPGKVIANVLQVPVGAVQEHQGEKFVFVQEEAEEFERRDVTVGRASDGMVEIVAGLKPGEPVVVQGAFDLKSELLRGAVGGTHAH
jgi:cobalt-zinc-cadmium efflux system membrane fusion protein